MIVKKTGLRKRLSLIIGSFLVLVIMVAQPITAMAAMVGISDLVEQGDVVFVVDNSGSISMDGTKLQERNRVLRSITNMLIGEDSRVGVVFFGQNVNDRDILPLTSVEDESLLNSTEEGAGSVLAFVNKDRDVSNDDTDIGNALRAAEELFDDSERAKTIILITDGIDENSNPNPEEATKSQVLALADENVAIVCLYYRTAKNNLGVLNEIVNYYNGRQDYSYRLVVTEDIPDIAPDSPNKRGPVPETETESIETFAETIIATESVVETEAAATEKQSGLPVPLIAGLAAAVIVLIIVIMKMKGKDEPAADPMKEHLNEYKRLTDSLETKCGLCTEEAVRFEKLRKKAEGAVLGCDYDFSNASKLKQELKNLESLLSETRIKKDNITKNSAAGKDAQMQMTELCGKLRAAEEASEKLLQQLKKEKDDLEVFLANQEK